MCPSTQKSLGLVDVMLEPLSLHATPKITAFGRIAVSVEDEVVENVVWPTLAPLSAVYPGFERWFRGKVHVGIAGGRRRVFVVGPHWAPLAIAIAKRERAENKLCTLWVAPQARGSGVGSDLVEEVFDWLGDRSPLLTVPSERFTEFGPLIRRYGFVETARMTSLYRPGVVEHVFNGSPSSFRSS